MLQRYEEALSGFERLLRLKPDDAVALNLRGVVLLALQRVEEALSDFERALRLEPRYPEALANRARCWHRLHRFEQALVDYSQALACKPRMVETLYNRANVFLDLYRFEEASRAFDDLLEMRPDYPYAAGYAFHSRLHCCDWSDFVARRERLIEAVASGKPADTPFQFLAVCDSPARQLQCARTFIADAYPVPSPGVPKKPRSPRERIRLAYLSADYGEHATSRLIAGLIESHDRSRFEVTAVAFSHHPDSPLLARLRRGFDRFLDVRAANDLAVAQLLSDLEIDIAVDLKGITGEARIGVFAYHVPPVQVSYLGYPGTMGAPFIDYLIADECLVPPAERMHYSEKVVYLPECYQVNDSRRGVAERTPDRRELGLPPEGFVFSSFSGCYKITPEVFDVWMRLLERVPGSVLWLREAIPAAVRNLRSEAARRGVDPERLIFAAGAPQAEHLARHRAADLFLDTLPINAHTTASDALWAGLPLVTCRGSAFAGRVAASVLQAVGMPELITESLGDYEALALNLATTPALLAETRARLARQRLTAPLFDTARSCRHIEAAYSGMWERHLRGEPPQSFSVPAAGGASP
jgi:predicted O-linked N-acetylglucosamine transferase (SPINDLY family)